MKLIPVAPNTLINPEMIESIEVRDVSGQQVFVVVVNSRPIIVEVPMDKLMAELIKSGIDLSNQFFAG